MGGEEIGGRQRDESSCVAFPVVLQAFKPLALFDEPLLLLLLLVLPVRFVVVVLLLDYDDDGRIHKS